MKIIDLSKTIESNMEIYPGDPDIRIEPVDGIDEFFVSKITMGSHTGTHVDAFSHIDKMAQPIPDTPLDRFIAKAFLVDKSSDLPMESGLFFKDKIGLELLEKIIKANPIFVGGDLSEDLEFNLLKNKIITYTDLINLDQLPMEREFLFIGLPLKLKDCDGSPVRAVALLD